MNEPSTQKTSVPDCRADWRFQRWCVYPCFIVAVVGTFWVLGTLLTSSWKSLNWQVVLVMTGGWAATLISGFINWRCPNCLMLLQTSHDSGTGRLFSTMIDALPDNPDYCSGCGARLL